MSKTKKITTFAVLDFETNTLSDYNFNKASIIEMSIHGFDAKHVRQGTTCEIPRIIHKLTLLFNPRAMIHPEAEKITGLDNYMLENESWFDTNAANGLISFLKHLQQPVCLVAHNGDVFDFPVLKQALDKIQVALPSDILCIDSLTTIRELDRLAEERKEIISSLESEIIPLTDAGDSSNVISQKAEETPIEKENVESSLTAIREMGRFAEERKEIIPLTDADESTVAILQPLADNVGDSSNVISQKAEETPIEKVNIESIATIIQDSQEDVKKVKDWKKINETTPKRPTSLLNAPRENKRQRIIEDGQNIKPRRSLFETPTTETKTKVFNEPGKYKLENIYRRLFQKSPENLHHAEGDVIALSKVMLHYGSKFMEYAEYNAKPFSEVKKLGKK